MPYITTTDVVAAAPGIDISGTSRPTLSQVNDMIDTEGSALDSTLSGMGYGVPIVGVESLKIVKKIVTHRVLAAVLRAKAFGKANPRDIGADTADSVAQKLIDRLSDPDDELTLIDAVVTDSTKPSALEGAGGLEGQSAVDYPVPITRYTRF